MKQLYSITFVFVVLFAFLSCEDEELKAPVPAYLHIEDIIVQNLPPDSDTASDNIKDAWVFIDDQSIGTFELPAIIPIQKTGKLNLKIRGGIFNNALSNDRAIYPFYDFYILDTVLNPEEHFHLDPLVKYRSLTVFDDPWSGEDFESGINFEPNSRSDTILVRETDSSLVFDGNASGAAYLAPSMNFFEAYTPTFSDIPRGTSPAYLELNYKCSHDIVISIYTNNRASQFPIVNLRARNTWNKAYVEMGSVFSTLFSATNYNVAIGYSKPVGEEGFLFIDNVKLLHF